MNHYGCWGAEFLHSLRDAYRNIRYRVLADSFFPVEKEQRAEGNPAGRLYRKMRIILIRVMIGDSLVRNDDITQMRFIKIGQILLKEEKSILVIQYVKMHLRK